jgi:hypothetical protein
MSALLLYFYYDSACAQIHARRGLVPVGQSLMCYLVNRYWKRIVENQTIDTSACMK